MGKVKMWLIALCVLFSSVSCMGPEDVSANADVVEEMVSDELVYPMGFRPEEIRFIEGKGPAGQVFFEPARGVGIVPEGGI